MKPIVALALVVGVSALAAPQAFAEELEVKLVSITSTVRTGDMFKLTVQTEAGATCAGTIFVPQGNATVPLSSKSVGDDGQVTWQFRVGAVRGGQRNVTVTCKKGDRDGKLDVSYNHQN